MKSLLLYTLAAALLLVTLPAISGCNGSRDTAWKMINATGNKGFMTKELVRGDRHRKYGLFVPMAYNANSTNQKFPVIIFLHGVGEGGSDAKANMFVGLAPIVADSASTFPFIVIFPQSSSGQWGPDSENANDVIAELDVVSKEYPVDKDRVILTGLSTGGYGTWAIGAKYKERFAALVPMGSSASDFGDAPKLVDMPIRVYHNNGDPFAAMWNDEVMVSKIQTLGGKAVLFKTNGPGHDCWEIAYGEMDLLPWMQQQRRKGSAPSPAPSPSASASPSSGAVPTMTPMVNPPKAPPTAAQASSAVVPTPF